MSYYPHHATCACGCGQVFEYQRVDRQFATNACRQKAYRRRAKEARAERLAKALAGGLAGPSVTAPIGGVTA